MRDPVTSPRLELQLQNALPEIHRLADALQEFCTARGIPDDACFQLTLVLDELLTNVISYGYDGGTHEIAVAIEHHPDAISAEIADGGRAFDPLSVAEPDLTSPIETRPVGGLGIHFLRTLMEQVEYERRDGRNHLRFRKRLA